MCPSSGSQCAACGKEATQRCAGCMSAPINHGNDTVDTYYCGRECQKKHWPEHKKTCLNLRDRKKLQRAAAILKDAFLAYKKRFYEYNILKIQRIKGKVILYTKPGVGTWKPFPTNLHVDQEEQDAALTYDQCIVSSALLSRLVTLLLPERTVRRTSFMMCKAPYKTVIHGLEPPIPSQHETYEITLPRSNEAWIIDPCGSQFGVRGSLYPLRQYQDKFGFVCGRSGFPINTDETEDFAFWNIMCAYNTPENKADRDTELKTRQCFADFVKGHAEVLKTIVQGSDEEHQKKKDIFMTSLEAHMAVFPG